MAFGIREWLMTGAALFGAAAANAQGQPRPAVVELFTSEGCSSCPPAESYIGELAQRHEVLALAYHVDYWDDLGWRDRFALSEATRRQSLYAQNLRNPSVYTPQIVIDGQSDFVGSNRSAIDRAVKANREGVPVAVFLHDAEVVVRLEPSNGAKAGPKDVILVTYLRKAVSAIGRGENAGRTLQESNIVRSFRSLGRWNGQALTFSAQVASLPADATDAAVLLQSIGQGPIVGAATVALR
jgi:hypothetical protein